MAHTHDMVAHMWANQSGRNNVAKGFNMYYYGDTIYSYGTHFPIARHVDGVILFTTNSYGISTSKHCTITRRAIGNFRVFNVANVCASTDVEHAKNLRGIEARFTAMLESSLRRRNPLYAESDLSDAQDILVTYGDYCGQFDLVASPLTMPDMDEFREKLRRRMDEKREVEKATRLRREAAAQAEAERIEREVIPGWLAGENVTIPWSYIAKGHMLRIKGDNIETTGRATFPVADAMRVIPLLQRARGLLHDERIECSMPIGAFKVDHVTSQGVRAGCHFVEWSEVDRIAKELGL